MRRLALKPDAIDHARKLRRALLVIELDGGQHRPEIDAARTRFIEAQGYRVLRFWNNDVRDNIAGVVGTIAMALPS